MPDGRFMHCHQDHLRKGDKVVAVPDQQGQIQGGGGGEGSPDHPPPPFLSNMFVIA